MAADVFGIRAAGRYPMFTRIVVPLDGSGLAARALSTAEELSRATGVPIHLVRVLDFNYPARLADEPVEDAFVDFIAFQQAFRDERDAAVQYLEDVRDDLSERGIRATTELALGDPVKEIVAVTKPGDVVVMGSQGCGGIARWYVGSVAEGVVRRARAAVMIVRPSGVAT
jgi:nucleotide-binding universal stress UspA family protein